MTVNRLERFAVLGSNSFSGSHFIRRLLRDEHEVLGLSRSTEIEQVFRAYGWERLPGHFSFTQLDINDADALAGKLTAFRPHVVVNFAAQSMVAQSWDCPEHWYRTNVLGLVNLARVLEILPSLQRYVHVTTPEVYGSTNGWIQENWNFSPSTPYAISRAAGDFHLRSLQQIRGLPVCFTRAANVYGPGQQLYRVVPRTLLYAQLGKRLRLDGGGRSTRSFIHIRDVAEATYVISQKGVHGETYHISTDEIVSVRDLVERVCELTGVSFADLAIEGPERPGKDNTYMLNSAHLREQLSWSPALSLDQGLRDTLNWVTANVENLSRIPDAYAHKK